MYDITNDPSRFMDLSLAEYAYMYGFLQADGHLYEGTRNRGHLVVELSHQDRHILESFSSLTPYYSSIRERTRNTNFKSEYRSAAWTVCHLGFRRTLIELGFTAGRKATSLTIPKTNFSQVDYFRGWIDADGAVGLTSSGLPFINLTCSSEALGTAYLDFIFNITGKHKVLNRNIRDKIFNISVFREAAQTLVAAMYYDGCLALLRKHAKAKEMMAWVRPSEMRVRPPGKWWTDEEDAFITANSVEESSLFLNRSVKSIKMRLWRLRDKV